MLQGANILESNQLENNKWEGKRQEFINGEWVKEGVIHHKAYKLSCLVMGVIISNHLAYDIQHAQEHYGKSLI